MNLVTPAITETATNYVDHLGGVALLISAPNPSAHNRCNYLAESESDGLAVVWTDCPKTAETLWQTSDVCARIA